jgi:HK97 family phage prohead protease
MMMNSVESLTQFLRDGGIFRSPAHFAVPGEMGMKRTVFTSTPSPFLRHSVMSAEAHERIGRESISAQSVVLTGLAVPFGKTTTSPSGLLERFQPGCFAASLDRDDIRMMFGLDFDSQFILGRNKAGTVRFWEAPDGLRFECYPPATTWADDLLVSVERRDITGTGLACIVKTSSRQVTPSGDIVRVITSAQVVMVAIAPFGEFDEGVIVTKLLANTPPSAKAVEAFIRNARGESPVTHRTSLQPS